MDERQKEFLQALADCGLSMGTLLAVGTVIKTEASRMLLTKRILEAEDSGAKITDSLVLQILTDLMKEATAEE
jgi:hypothetical protein